MNLVRQSRNQKQLHRRDAENAEKECRKRDIARRSLTLAALTAPPSRIFTRMDAAARHE